MQLSLHINKHVLTLLTFQVTLLLLLAGFPLTDAKLAGAYAVVSAHDTASVDWAAFRAIPTLVILMGGRALPLIVQQLQATGWADDTHVSVRVHQQDRS
jgi:siroheme synthase